VIRGRESKEKSDVQTYDELASSLEKSGRHQDAREVRGIARDEERHDKILERIEESESGQ